MTVQRLVDLLVQVMVDGRAKPEDLVVMVEYDRVHLRPAPEGHLDTGVITITRESRPLHGPGSL